MDHATIREDTNALSSVGNTRQRQGQLERYRLDVECRAEHAEAGKRRTKTVVYGLAYSPFIRSFRDQ